MQASLLRELISRRISIRTRWEALLRAEPVTTPLGYPDALVHLIDTTLNDIFATLESRSTDARGRRAISTSEGPHCPCGRNPLLAYFAAGKQAVLEALIFAQAASAPLDPVDRDVSLAELNDVLRGFAAREIEAFCGVCQFRHLALAAPAPTLALCGG